MSTRSTKEDHVRPRLPIHLQILGETPWDYGHQDAFQLSLSSVDRWSNGKDQPNLRRYAEGLRREVWKKLGQESALRRVLVQQ
jgi:hypothetical protein